MSSQQRKIDNLTVLNFYTGTLDNYKQEYSTWDASKQEAWTNSLVFLHEDDASYLDGDDRRHHGYMCAQGNVYNIGVRAKDVNEFLKPVKFPQDNNNDETNNDESDYGVSVLASSDDDTEDTSLDADVSATILEHDDRPDTLMLTVPRLRWSIVPDETVTLTYYSDCGTSSQTWTNKIKKGESLVGSLLPILTHETLTFYKWDKTFGDIINEDTSINAIWGICVSYNSPIRLTETTTEDEGGLHKNAFGGEMISHSYTNGVGTVIFDHHNFTIGKKAFYKSVSMTGVTIPNTFDTIGEYAFNECTSLISVVIPNDVKTIGKCAFMSCSKLSSVTLPSNLTSISEQLFYDCHKLSTITIPDSVGSIGNSAFAMSGVTVMNFPSSLTNINNMVCYGCDNLSSVNIPYGVTAIDSKAFGNCITLMDINIPNSVLSIGSEAFVNCSALGTITLPINLSAINNDTFFGCSSLTGIIIPDNVITIGTRAFGKCTSLNNATIGDSVTTIGDNAFINDLNMRGVTIGKSVSVIGDSCFSGCVKLASIVFDGTMDAWRTIKKGSKWHYNVQALYVTCSNGQVPISEN